MKFKWPWQKKKEYAELESMERLLDSILKPVAPSKEFSNKLRSELIGKPKRKLFGLEIPNARMGWALVGGIFGSAILLANAIVSITRFAKFLDKAGKKKKGQIQAAI